MDSRDGSVMEDLFEEDKEYVENLEYMNDKKSIGLIILMLDLLKLLTL